MANLTRFAFTIGAAALVAGCALPLSSSKGQGDMQPPVAMPNSAGIVPHVVPGSSYQVLYRFDRKLRDGVHPLAGLVNVNGTLYGTTSSGGKYGHGTVYSVTTTGTESVLHDFRKNGSDGEYPHSGLIDIRGTLYGTTKSGGAYGSGTVFSITTTGTEKVLYSFGGSGDGAEPYAGLVEVKGTLYGTTQFGGKTCGSTTCGTVFSVSTTGQERVLYEFAGGSDGANPVAGLIDVNGALYGTTFNGGLCSSNIFGCGTVFSVTTTGTEKVLHSFGKGDDGVSPAAGLVDVNGVLYGTTLAAGCCWGTVFSVTTAGKERVLHTFRGSSGGYFPEAGLTDIKGTLFGTTAAGGKYRHGTLYSVTTTGTEQVVHSFGGDSADGADPVANLMELNGTLYGTTKGGGDTCLSFSSCGTVFAFSP